jgi:SAM-dependent methyltransferase
VLTDPKFRSKNIDSEAKSEFFATGEQHVRHVLGIVRKFIDPEFAPALGLDFGCGTGRVTIAMAQVMDEAVGIDISDSMLREAEKNTRERELKNIRFHKSDDHLSALKAYQFDFVHTCIVLQHIPPARVRTIFAQLLGRLKDGGVGAIQLTYANADFTGNYGMPPTSPAYRAKRLYRRFRSYVARKVLPHKDPEMQMNLHLLNQLFYLLQTAGVRNFHTEFTNDGGSLGIFLYFKKKPDGHSPLA